MLRSLLLPIPLVLALALSAGDARAQPAGQGPDAGGAPSPLLSGLAVTATMATGGETGMATGKSGLLELELAAGWEHEPTRLRPELGIAFGIATETAVSLRPGVRAGLAEVPVWLRAALDFSTARRQGLHARWVLFGGAWELRLNTVLAFDLGIEFGIPMARTAGVPIMLRAGGTFRL